MKYLYSDFQQRLPNLAWKEQELADKLSLIGHETEVNKEELDVTLTSNRKDCKSLEYLIFDLAGIYNIPTTVKLQFGHRPEIPVTAEDINRLLGSHISFEDMKKLERLGFVVTEQGVQPPDFRDIETKADVAEEIGRIIGFDQLEIQPLDKEEAIDSQTFRNEQNIKAALQAIGLTETRTYSFASYGEVELKNPFSVDEPYLRPTLLDGLLQTLARNPYLKRAIFFELGEVFTPEEGSRLGIIVCGYKSLEHWETLLEKTLGNKVTFGAVDEQALQKHDVKQGKVYWCELALADIKVANSSAVSDDQPLTKFKPISKFPPLVRDVTTNLKDRPFADIRTEATQKFGEPLLLIEPIDSYTNPETGEVATTLRFIFQKMTDTFTQAEIDALTAELNSFLN